MRMENKPGLARSREDKNDALMHLAKELDMPLNSKTVEVVQAAKKLIENANSENLEKASKVQNLLKVYEYALDKWRKVDK